MSYCAVVVTFYPNDDLSSNIVALHGQVDEIIIVDNGSGKSYKELLEKQTEQSCVNIIYNQENIGIAAALNLGVEKAKAHNHEWVITFDQDSQATPNMINIMIQAYEMYPQKDTIASLSPRYKNIKSGEICGSQLSLPFDKTLPYAEAHEVLTSGNLLKLSVIDVVGGFNEALFIDYVDIEYCWRCISYGYKILEVKEATLLHGIGLPIRHKFLWGHPITMNHGAIRRYYIARNAVYVFKVFIFSHSFLVLTNIYHLFKTLIKISIFETDRKKKFVATFFGFVDGCLGRMGKCKRDI